MSFEHELEKLAERYATSGYRVTVRPSADQLPPFAKDFQIEILAERRDGNALVSAKKNQSALMADDQLVRYAEVIEGQPGWRYDLAVLEREDPLVSELRGSREPSADEATHALQEAERTLDAGFVNAALLAAWACLETVMRRMVLAEWAGAPTTPRALLTELYSSGRIPFDQFPALGASLKQRYAISHGFVPSPVEPETVRLILSTARSLWDESQTMKQPA